MYIYIHFCMKSKLYNLPLHTKFVQWKREVYNFAKKSMLSLKNFSQKVS